MLEVAVLSLSLLVCFFGGFLPMFVPSLTLEIVLRVICGFGVGLIRPLSASLIVDCFKKGSEADALMGIRSTMVGLGATIFSSAITGMTSTWWKSLNFAAVLMIVCIIMIVAFNAFDKKRN